MFSQGHIYDLLFKIMNAKRNRLLTSLAIILASVGLSYVPGLEKTVVVVSGTELQEILPEIEAKFEEKYPNINLELKYQGSQDIVNNFIDDRNDFTPTVLIPANGEILKELESRWRAQNNSDPFYNKPEPIAKTMLVGISWPERGRTLFPSGRFDWRRVEAAMQAGDWSQVGGKQEWGSFDFATTNPSRSNSGQLTLSLMATSKIGGGNLTAASLNNPQVRSLFGLVKRSVYLPPRSTDILLQEFITKGPNDADVATVYESIALYRWQQSSTTQGKAYQIYYLNPTIETRSTAAIVRRDVGDGTAEAARKLIDFLKQPEQQGIFVRYGFRPVNPGVDLTGVPNSPWKQNIPGAEVSPEVRSMPTPDADSLTEIKRLWERAN